MTFQAMALRVALRSPRNIQAPLIRKILSESLTERGIQLTPAQLDETVDAALDILAIVKNHEALLDAFLTKTGVL